MKRNVLIGLFIVAVIRLPAQLEVVSGGNVGVGTSSPNFPADIATGTVQYALPALNIQPSGHTTSERATIGFGFTAPSITDGWILGQDYNATGVRDFYLLSRASGASNVRMLVSASGHMGIGTANPARRLSVESTAATHTEIAGFLAPSMGSGNVTYALIGRAAAAGQSGIWGHQYDSTTANSFTWMANYGDSHTTGGIAIKSGGNVGIGTSAPGYKLQVAGIVRATSFISDTTTYADFVFKPDFVLPSLSEVEAHIRERGHLPGIPSEAEAKAVGIDLAAMQVKLLQKVEELTLHVIAHEKQLGRLQQENAALRQELAGLKHP